MRKGQFLAAACSLLLVYSFALPQSLVELAAKEKARRARLENEKSIVLTNADLKKITASSAVNAVKAPEVESPSAERNAEKSPPAAPAPRINVTVSQKQNTNQADKQDLSDEGELKKTEEIAAILTLKLRSLWQEFYSMDDMTPRHLIQQEISRTFLQWQESREKINQLRQKLNLPPLENEEGAIFIKLNH
jgi:hypothetical protein